VPQQTQKQNPHIKPAKPHFKFQGNERLAKFDMPLFIVTIVLLVFGGVMLLSSSFFFAGREHDGDSYHYFYSQVTFMGIGLAALIVISFIDYRILMKPKIVAMLSGASVIMMLAVKMGLGVTQGGAERWLGIGSLVFQPSEIMKFALIILLAYIAHKHSNYLKTFKGFLLFCFIIAIACGLTIWQPHLSGTIIMAGIGLTLMIISNVKFRYVFIACAGAVLIGMFVLNVMESMGFTYFEDRFLSWHNPEADIQDKTFQTYQSLVAIGSGGWFGLGLGNSRQKFSYLPATHNDFIFSVICEELGFVGGTLVLLLFVIFVLRGFYIASRARDRFGIMVAVGITSQIGIQAFLNIAVVTNSVPNTGITLPFFSYGGTALVMLMAQIGVLLNISRKARIE